MKIYVFNCHEEWETEGAVAIVAEDQAAAERMYCQKFEKLAKLGFDVDEVEIENGLMLEANGYDNTTMSFELLNPI